MSINSFFVAGRYVGEDLPALTQNKFAEFYAQEELVHPGAFVFGYATPSVTAYQEIFGEELFGKPTHSNGLYIGTGIYADLELITGREPSADVTIVNDHTSFPNLLEELNQVMHIHVGLLHREHPELAAQAFNRDLDAKYGPIVKQIPKPKSLLQQLQYAIRKEQYELAAQLRDEISAHGDSR